jgi:hypothetical protein
MEHGHSEVRDRKSDDAVLDQPLSTRRWAQTDGMNRSAERGHVRDDELA